MRASPGDRIVVKGHRVGEPDRDCEVLEVGDEGEPPYRVRWGDGATRRCSSRPRCRDQTHSTRG